MPPAAGANDPLHNGQGPPWNRLVDGITYSLYGDPAYPQSAYVYGGYRNPQPGTPAAAWNTQNV